MNESDYLNIENDNLFDQKVFEYLKNNLKIDFSIDESSPNYESNAISFKISLKIDLTNPLTKKDENIIRKEADFDYHL